MKHHPLTILLKVINLVKSSFIFILILFVLNFNSDFWLYHYGRYVFVIVFTWLIIHIILSWFHEKYEWKDRAFHIYKGVWNKETSTIPFNRIQNVTRRTTWFHKLFGVTSITFETAMDGKDDEIKFEVVSLEQARFLTELVQGEEWVNSQVEDKQYLSVPENSVNREVLFSPSKRDLWKASFTSFSFFAIIPIVGGLIDNIEPLLPNIERFEGVFDSLFNSSWMIVIAIGIAILVAVIFGVAQTFLRYGKYEISHNETQIFIERGVINESYFVIDKSKIQAIEIKQQIVKRLFGLAEVKLISSANPNQEDEAVKVNSLYPFLPLKEAYQLIEELVPEYTFNYELVRLPKSSLAIKLLRPSWLWLIATAALYYFKPNILDWDIPWWVYSLTLLVLIVVNRFLDYFHTKYSISGDQLQWWRGGLTSRLFMTKRQKIIEVSLSQSLYQKPFKLMSVQTTNRSTPKFVEGIQDVPDEFGQHFQEWYWNRREDVKVH